MNPFKLFKRIGHSKTVHAGNYMVLLGLRDRRDSPHRHDYTLSSFKLNKLMYYVDGLAYVRLGRGITDALFERSIYSIYVASLDRKWRGYGQLDLLLHLEYEYRSSYNDDFLPHFLLSDEERKVIEEVWEAFRTVSQWKISESIKTQSPYLKMMEKDVEDGDSLLFMDKADIELNNRSHILPLQRQFFVVSGSFS